MKKYDKIAVFSFLKSQNNWGKKKKKIPKYFGFMRAMYWSKIQPLLGKDIIKVLVGQRRVGKSHIMQQIIHHLYEQNISPDNIFYFNKESIELLSITTVEQLQNMYTYYLSEIIPEGRKYICIDEVQDIEGWEKFITSYSALDDYEVFITGSNSHLLSGELSTYLTGRYIKIEVFPFVFKEYIDFLDLPRDKKSYIQFLQTGGLPFLLKLSEKEDRIEYIKTLKNTILFKDIVQRYSLKNSVFLEQLFLFLAQNIGNLFSPHSIATYMKAQGVKVNNETIAQYLQYLQFPFLVQEVERFDLQGKKILENKKKYYLTDSGFRSYLFSSFDSFLGKQLENALFIEFKSQGYQVFSGDLQGKEIDFVLEKNGRKKYVQVAHTIADESVAKREFGNLLQIKDSYPKEVITLDDISFGQSDGVEHRVAWEV